MPLQQLLLCTNLVDTDGLIHEAPEAPMSFPTGCGGT